MLATTRILAKVLSIILSMAFTMAAHDTFGDNSSMFLELKNRCKKNVGDCFYKGEPYHCCTMLGKVYFDGEGVEKDADIAAKYWKIACEQEDGKGCALYGIVLNRIFKNPRKAYLKQEKACALGEARGCYFVGMALLKGEVVAKDLVRARQLWKRACDDGDGAACHEYSGACLYGKGGEIDLEEACKATTVSCKLGYELGCESKSTTCHWRLHHFLMAAFPATLGLFFAIWLSLRRMSARLRLLYWVVDAVLVVAMLVSGFWLDVIPTNYWTAVAALAVFIIVVIPTLIFGRRRIVAKEKQLSSP